MDCSYYLKPRETKFEALEKYIQVRIQQGLQSDPRLFIASKLIREVLGRFNNYSIWSCLKAYAANYDYDDWRPFLMNPASFPLWELFPSQMTAIKSGILSDSSGVYSMQMPTSSGKTSLCEIVIYNEVKARDKRVLFLVPFRALASEIRDGISKRLEAAGVKVIASHGGNIPSKSEGVTAETADVLITTPEKFAALVQAIPELYEQFDTVICDEGHLIDDGSRGLQYELLLTKLKASNESIRKIIFISAILPNVDEIHSWLGGMPQTLAKSDYKPVEIDFAFITPQGESDWQLDFNTIYARPRSYFLRSFLTSDDFRYTNPSSGRPKLIAGRKSKLSLACAAALKARKNGPVALFTTMKGKNGVKGLANKLIDLCSKGASVALNPPQPSPNLPILIEYMSFQFGEEHLLTKLLANGAAFHHGDLPQEIRREVEAAIQNEAITLLICTSTLAEGVNLPIRTLVVHTIKRFNGSVLLPIQQRSIKNIVGRAGRAGKETRGRIIFANDSEREVVEAVFSGTQMEPARGALFQLIRNLNEAVVEQNIQLSNEIFESQEASFLSIIDGIDVAIIDLIPLDILHNDMEIYIEGIIEKTLAFSYCDTDQLKERIKEVFILRTQHLQAKVPENQWIVLKGSGAAPRFWSYANDRGLLGNELWKTLSDVLDDDWLDGLVFDLLDFPTISIEQDRDTLKAVISCWMQGKTYNETSALCGLDAEDTLKLLGHAIGYQLQDAVGKLTQLAIGKHIDDELSDLSRNWTSLLQYGLGSLQQLDLFELGASDRLGVWGISRYLDSNSIDGRGIGLVRQLRDNAEQVISALEQDVRVPRLSIIRVCDELKIAS